MTGAVFCCNGEKKFRMLSSDRNVPSHLTTLCAAASDGVLIIDADAGWDLGSIEAEPQR